MILLRAGGSPGARTGLVGLALLAVGVLILLSGVALLLLVALAGAAAGGAVMLVRRALGKGRRGRAGPDRAAPLELEADFEILPAEPRTQDVAHLPAPDTGSRRPGTGGRQDPG